MEGNNQVINPGDFFASVETKVETPVSPTEQTPITEVEETLAVNTDQHAKSEDTEIDSESELETEETPSEDTKVESESEDEDDELTLPENATKSQHQAFARLRKKNQELKEKLKDQPRSDITEEDKTDLDFYRSNKNRIDSSLDIVKTLVVWQNDPKKGAEQLKANFPAVYAELEASLSSGSTPATPTVNEQENVLEDLGINIEDIEEESSTIAQGMKTLVAQVAQLKKELAQKNEEIIKKVNSTEEEFKRAREEEAKKLEQSRADQVRNLEVEWYNTINESLKDYGLKPDAAGMVYTNVITKLNEDINAGKFKTDNITDLKEKVKITEYTDKVLGALGIKKVEAVTAEIKPKAPTGIKNRLTKPHSATLPKVVVKTSSDFMDLIEGSRSK